MELKYLVTQWNQKRTLLMIKPEEEPSLCKKLNLSDSRHCQIIFTGTWKDTLEAQEAMEQWILGSIERLVITSRNLPSERMSTMICKAYLRGVSVEDLDTFLLEVDPTVPANSNQLIHYLTRNGVKQDLGCRIYSKIKYAFEPVIALVLLLLLSPVLLIVALAVKLTSPGPMIYTQARVGYRNKVFNIYKFRSMTLNIENGKAAWAKASPHDPGLTPIGGFLRATHLDELPQLWNILVGDLSFIGPRPERPEFVQELSHTFPLFKLRPLIKPGITGWAQVKQGYANSVQDSLTKLEFDLFYIIKHSPRIDVHIAFLTLFLLFTGGTEAIKRSRATKVVRAS